MKIRYITAIIVCVVLGGCNLQVRRRFEGITLGEPLADASMIHPVNYGPFGAGCRTSSWYPLLLPNRSNEVHLRAVIDDSGRVVAKTYFEKTDDVKWFNDVTRRRLIVEMLVPREYLHPALDDSEADVYAEAYPGDGEGSVRLKLSYFAFFSGSAFEKNSPRPWKIKGPKPPVSFGEAKKRFWEKLSETAKGKDLPVPAKNVRTYFMMTSTAMETYITHRPVEDWFWYASVFWARDITRTVAATPGAFAEAHMPGHKFRTKGTRKSWDTEYGYRLTVKNLCDGRVRVEYWDEQDR